MPRAVFFDRDDTLIRCRDITPDGDLGDPSLVELIGGAETAADLLKRRDYKLGVITNQGGVARGRYTTDEVEAVNTRLNELLGGRIDTFRYCPYHPEGVIEPFKREHFWRKPSPGMLLDAAEELGVKLSESWMVGDSPRDIVAGRAAGCRTVLFLRPGMGATAAAGADYAVSSLVDAAELIAASEPIEGEKSTVTLRALVGAPLRERAVRDVVQATARAIAERNGVKLEALNVTDDSVVAELETSRLAAVGFAAELRRLTNEWYRSKFGVTTLWGDPKEGRL
ncbi:MAG: HAD family hydrolase [Planctomycetota bacterium]